jgi:hypothetical protein
MFHGHYHTNTWQLDLCHPNEAPHKLLVPRPSFAMTFNSEHHLVATPYTLPFRHEQKL